MEVKSATDKMVGFDVDQPLSGMEAAEFVKAGYSFVVRYIPRTSALAKGCLTALETSVLLTANLAVSVVQHVAPENWMPSADLGKSYGEFAGQYCKSIGLPANMNIWLDLEMISTSATVENVAEYCKAWYVAVTEAGYLASVYVGWQVILDGQQLYSLLPFRAYWSGYNTDISVATRGYQMEQSIAKPLNGIQFDKNVVQKDELGDLPMFLFNS